MNKPPDLLGDLRRLQSPQQVLTFDGQSDHDGPDQLTGFYKQLLAPLRPVGRAGFQQQRDDLAHFRLDQPVDVDAHGPDIAVDLHVLEPVVFQLLQLEGEDTVDQLTGHASGSLLVLLLQTQGPGIQNVVGWLGTGRDCQEPECNGNSEPLHATPWTILRR